MLKKKKTTAEKNHLIAIGIVLIIAGIGLVCGMFDYSTTTKDPSVLIVILLMVFALIGISAGGFIMNKGFSDED